MLLGKQVRKPNDAKKESMLKATLRKASPTSIDVSFLPNVLVKSFFPTLTHDLSQRDADAAIVGLADDLGTTRKAELQVRGIYHLASSESAEAIRRLAGMNPRRVPSATGILCDNTPISPMSVTKKEQLSNALARLLHRLLLPAEIPVGTLPHDVWFRDVICPLVCKEDGHILGLITAISMALSTGRLDLAVAGLFGAGKTRAVAVLFLSLIAIDPDIRVAVICKENTAARSMASLMLSLNPPREVLRMCARTPSNDEYRNIANRTAIDVHPPGRHMAYGANCFLVATAGLMLSDMVMAWSDLRHFCAELHIAYVEEAQQYGAQTEVGVVAALLKDNFTMYGGDHKQTPGGVPDNQEAKRLRCSLMRRPHALRAPTRYVMVQELHVVVRKLLEGSDILEAKQFDQALIDCREEFGLFESELSGPTAVVAHVHDLSLSVLGAPQLRASSGLVASSIFALLVLHHPEWVSHCQASDCLESAGILEPHMWGLLLPSSSRVTNLTYLAVVSCRYEQMCREVLGLWVIGTSASGGVEGLPSGFLPMVWELHPDTAPALRSKVVIMLVQWLQKQGRLRPRYEVRIVPLFLLG